MACDFPLATFRLKLHRYSSCGRGDWWAEEREIQRQRRPIDKEVHLAFRTSKMKTLKVSTGRCVYCVASSACGAHRFIGTRLRPARI